MFVQSKTERARTSRAYVAYQDLLDTADWLRDMMSRQLASFDLTMTQYRVLETLYRDGPQYQQALSRKFECNKQIMARVIKRLEEGGCVQREGPRLTGVADEAPAQADAGEEDKGPSKDRRIILVRLTPEGEELIANVIPKHAKVVRAEMRALDGRQQLKLSLLCRRLRAGDAVKTYKEFMRGEVEEEVVEAEEVREA
jgi:MarR family transcriptional regulator, 2-MHQ and catechol-resistance regulon repressor